MEESINIVNISITTAPINTLSAANENSKGETKHTSHNKTKTCFPLTQQYEYCIKYKPF